MPASGPGLPPALARPLTRLRADLQDIFGARLSALVAHGPRVRHAIAAGGTPPPISTLALVDGLAYRDLAACAQHAGEWRADGLAVPLLLGRAEFARSLDAFPIEYGDIIAHHLLVYGDDPFEGVSVNAADLRRACEAWAKAHLIQLREGFVEAGGDPRRVVSLVLASASPFTALLSLVARLRGLDDAQGPDALARATEGIAGLPAAIVAQVVALEGRPVLDPDTAATLFPAYLDAVSTLVGFLDGWSRG